MEGLTEIQENQKINSEFLIMIMYETALFENEKKPKDIWPCCDLNSSLLVAMLILN